MGIDTQSNADLMALKQRYQAIKQFNLFNQKAEQLIPTFHPIWHKPLMTVNGRHVLTDAMRYCGMRNIFASAKGLTPTVSFPQVLREQPKIIVMTTSNSNDLIDKNSPWYGLIQAFPEQSSLKPKVITVNGERFHQPGPSLIDETLALCKTVSNLHHK
jgi:iron complex transport system substrate-binding protein